MPTLVQINFPSNRTLDATRAEELKEIAEGIAEEDGLIWKIWIGSPERGELGGIYLFDTPENAQSYADKHTARIETRGITDSTAKLFEVDETLTHITHGGHVLQRN